MSKPPNESDSKNIEINRPNEFNALNNSSSTSDVFTNYAKEEGRRIMSYNHSSSYNRTYERKVIEEGGAPSVRIHSSSSSSPLHTIKSTLGGAFPSASSSFINPHNYHFGTSTSGSFHSSDDSLSVTLDVSAFSPEELKVTVIGNHIVVEGKHPEKPDDIGLIERHFVRKFPLPRNAHPDTVSSNLSADGQLVITAQSPNVKENSPARTIPIKIVTSPTPSTTTNGQQQQPSDNQSGN